MAPTRAIFLAASLALGGCGLTPAKLGITGPGGGAPPTFTPVVQQDDGLGPPGIPASGSPYSGSNRPAGDAARQGDYYGYN